MEITPTKNLTQQLVHDLGVAIVQGAFSADKGMPSEADICQQYEISRSATREAIKMLTAKGLLSSRPRQGIRIQPKTNWNLFDTDVLSWILSEAPTLEMLKHFLQLRLAFEPEAAALASTNANPGKIRAIEATLTQPPLQAQQTDGALNVEIAFHTAILAATENPFYMQLRSFMETALKVEAYFSQLMHGTGSSDTFEKQAIYKAIAAGEAEAARLILRKRLTGAIDALESELKNSPANEPRTHSG